MTDGYVEQRRAYVAAIRNSFESEDAAAAPEESGREHVFPFFRTQLWTALFIFFVFLFLKMTGYELYGFTADAIIEKISDNHYYTNLMEYDTIQEWDAWLSELTGTPES